MDLTTLLADTIQKNGVAVFLIAFGAWFLTFRVWPFVTGVWWPNTNDRQNKQTTLFSELSAAVVALKVFTEQMVAMLQQTSTVLNDHGQKLSDIQTELAAIRQRVDDTRPSALAQPPSATVAVSNSPPLTPP
jgi:uncharacterized coiled-coil protein SlyX